MCVFGWEANMRHTVCGHNVQCYMDKKSASFHVDSTFPMGPAGDNEFQKCMVSVGEQFMDEHGCSLF